MDNRIIPGDSSSDSTMDPENHNQYDISAVPAFYRYDYPVEAENPERTDTTQEISVDQRYHCVDDMLAGLGLWSPRFFLMYLKEHIGLNKDVINFMSDAGLTESDILSYQAQDGVAEQMEDIPMECLRQKASIAGILLLRYLDRPIMT